MLESRNSGIKLLYWYRQFGVSIPRKITKITDKFNGKIHKDVHSYI